MNCFNSPILPTTVAKPRQMDVSTKPRWQSQNRWDEAETFDDDSLGTKIILPSGF